MNHKFADIDAFSSFLTDKAEQQLSTMNETAEEASSLLLEYAYDLYGENPPLAGLAEATQDDRVRRGHTPNDPLLRTGALLRDHVRAISSRVERRGRNDVATAAVGSREIINLYHETGYRNARTGRMVPPRPVFLITARMAGPKIAEIFSVETRRVFAS